MTKSLQQKIKFLVSIHGLNTSIELESFFGYDKGRSNSNTSCNVCKFNQNGLCTLSFVKRKKYVWEDMFHRVWCAAWIIKKKRK